jgi:hypothetical protein
VFWELVKLTTYRKDERTKLPFDVLELIAVEEDGSEDISKKKAIRKLFRPDATNKLSLLAFVQVRNCALGAQ